LLTLFRTKEDDGVFLKAIKKPVFYAPVDYLDKLMPGVD